MEQPPAELDVDAVGGVAQRIGAQQLQHALESAERHHADDQHHQRRQALVDEHLVDDELEEDRRRQREELHEQRGDHHLRQRLAVAQQRGQEPAEAEGVGIDAGAAEPAGDEHDLAGARGPGLLQRHVAGDAADGIDDAHPALGGADAEGGKAAVLVAQQRGVGDGAEPLGGDAVQDARFQAEDVGAADEILGVGEAADQRELMLQLGGIGGDAVIAGDQRQPHQPGIDRRRRRRRCGRGGRGGVLDGDFSP